VTFRFRGIGRRAFRALEDAHPPTEQQQAKAGESDIALGWNPDTFPPALVHASLVEPTGATLAQIQTAYDTWTVGHWALLWRACLIANNGVADPGPKSVLASVVLAGSATSSTTADPEASRTASSSVAE
jgi:hypothetical protein